MNERRRWVALGVAAPLLAFALGFYLAGRGDRPPDPAPAPPPASAADRDAAPAAAERPASCFLGAVVARETTDVGAEFAGVVARVLVRVGDEVAAGAPLAELERREVRHLLDAEQAQLRQAQAEQRRRQIEADQAADDLERRKALEGLVARSEQEAVQLRYAQAQAGVEAGEAEISRIRVRVTELNDRLARSVLRAPFAGRVAQRYLDAGARVEIGTPLVRILGDQQRLVRFAVPAEALGALERGAAVRVEVEEPRRTLDAAIVQIAPEIDPESLMIFVEASFLAADGAGDLPLGAAARVSLAAEAASCLSPPGR